MGDFKQEPRHTQGQSPVFNSLPLSATLTNYCQKILTSLAERNTPNQPEAWSLFIGLFEGLSCEAPLCDFNKDFEEMLLLLEQREALVFKSQGSRETQAFRSPVVARHHSAHTSSEHHPVTGAAGNSGFLHRLSHRECRTLWVPARRLLPCQEGWKIFFF